MNPYRRTHVIVTALAMLSGAASAAAGSEPPRVKVFPPTPEELWSNEPTGTATERQHDRRELQSGVYNQPQDRGRPFFGQAWSEDWGSDLVEYSDIPAFRETRSSVPFEPDRRPSVAISLFNGESNPHGMSNDWYAGGSESTDRIKGYSELDLKIAGSNGIPDSFDYLMSRLNLFYDKGFRRLILTLPAGLIDSDSTTEKELFDSAQYWTMDDWRRKWFWIEVRRWIQEKEDAGDPVSMGVYMGWGIHAPWEYGMDQAQSPDMSNPEHVAWMHQNINPWIRLGFKEIWFDAASSAKRVGGTTLRDRDVMASLRHSIAWGSAIRFCGEAIPGVNPYHCDQEPDSDMLYEAAWTALPAYIESRFGNELRDTDGGPVFDPDRTEVTYWIANTKSACEASGLWKDYCIEDYRRYLKQGLVFRAYHGRIGMDDYRSFQGAEFVQRLMSFGKITAPLDFDGDGFIEAHREADGSISGDDWNQFVEALIANVSSPRVRFFDGNINGDSVIDHGDFSTFCRLLDDWEIRAELTPVDLGDPWWVHRAEATGEPVLSPSSPQKPAPEGPEPRFSGLSKKF